MSITSSAMESRNSFPSTADSRDVTDGLAASATDLARRLADFGAGIRVGLFRRGFHQTVEKLRKRLGGSNVDVTDRQTILAEARADENEHDLGELLDAWFEEYRSELILVMTGVLVSMALRAVSKALADALARGGYSLCSAPRATNEMRTRSDERARLLASRFGDALRSDIESIVYEGIRNGHSTREIEQTVDTFLRDHGELERTARTIAEDAAFSTAADGFYEVHKSLGARTKQWHTRRDSRVCPVCRGNESAGQLPIDAVFPSGHLMTPAHYKCRCWIVVTRDEQPDLKNALRRFSMVCQNEPG